MKLSYITNLLLTTTSPILYLPPEPVRPNPLILISGTQNARDLLVDDFDIRTAYWPPVSKRGGFVHKGFARRTRALFHKIHDFVESNDHFVIAGHSMGGSCCVLMATLLKEQGKEVDSVYTFGMPRMASSHFREYYDSIGLSRVSTHFTTPLDPVVHYIPCMFKTVGEYDTVNCTLKDAWAHHDMKAYHKAILEQQKKQLLNDAI